MTLLASGFNKARSDTYRGEFNVKRFGARLEDNIDNTLKLQEAVSEACAYAAAYGTGAKIVLPAGKCRVSETISITEDAVSLEGHGGGGDFFAKFGSCLIPTADFANDTYVLSFNSGEKTRTLYGNKLVGVNIFRAQADTLENTVHGLFWQCAKGLVTDVVIDNMTGRGCGIQGYDASWSTLYSKFFNVQFRRSGTNGCAVLGYAADMFFTNVVFGGSGAAGLLNPGAGNLYTACHLTGNETNVLFNGASVETVFQGCVMETPRKTNVDVNCTAGTIYRTKFVGCQLDASNLDANNTYDNIWVHRDSGGNTAEVIVLGCTFTSSGEGTVHKPRYHINLAGAVAVNCRIGQNTFQASTAATANINHNVNAVRCTVNGLGINGNNDPTSAGPWAGVGEEGVSVVNTTSGAVWMYAAGAFRALTS